MCAYEHWKRWITETGYVRPAEARRRGYTEKQRKIYAFIASQPFRTATTTEVIAMFYAGGRMPVNGRIIVNQILRALGEKLDRNRARVTLLRSSRQQGPHPLIWQLAPRSRNGEDVASSETLGDCDLNGDSAAAAARR